MTNYENLLLSIEDHILTITINRPEKLNALNFKTLEEIKRAFLFAYDNTDVSGIILTGSGDKAFVAGADINEIATLDAINARKISENGQEIFFLIENCPKPVIAAVNGYALGGGCELAMACHMRIASTSAQFGQPEVNLGIIPGYGGTQRLTHLIGKGRAIELMLTADMINAEDAHRMGLVNHIVHADDLIKKCKDILNKINRKPAVAVNLVIDCVNAVWGTGENGYKTEANSFSICCKDEDFKEGTQAFLEKRKPNFKGK